MSVSPAVLAPQSTVWSVADVLKIVRDPNLPDVLRFTSPTALNAASNDDDPFFLDPGGRLAAELGSYIDLLCAFWRERKREAASLAISGGPKASDHRSHTIPRPAIHHHMHSRACVDTSQRVPSSTFSVQVGKTTTVYDLFPAIVRQSSLFGPAGPHAAVFVSLNTTLYSRNGGAGEFLQDLLQDFCRGVGVPLASVVTEAEKTHSSAVVMVAAVKDAMAKLPRDRPTFVLLDEVSITNV